MKMKIIIVFIAIAAVMWQPAAAQSQSDEIVWLKLAQDLGIGDIVNAVFTPDDQSILVTDVNKKLIEIDAITGVIKREIPNIKGVIKFSDDGVFVYTYDFKKVNYQTGEEIGQFKIGDAPVTGFTEFDLNEKAGYLIGVQYSHIYPYNNWYPSVFVFDLNTFMLIDSLGIDRNFYRHIKITDDGKYFKTSSKYDPIPIETSDDDDVNMLWDAKTLQTIRECPELGYIKTSPDGKWLGSIVLNIVKVFDAITWENKYNWKQAPDSSDFLTAIDFTPDSRFIATSGSLTGFSEGAKNIANIHIWDLEKGKLSYKYSNGINGMGAANIRYNHIGNLLLNFSVGRLVIFKSLKTEIFDNPFPNEILLYPNPTTGEISIENSNILPGHLYIDLSNINSLLVRVLFDGIYDGTELRFNVSVLAAGTYFLKAVQGNSTYSYKLIKEN
jgi:WD40 repeat protein